MMPLETPIGQFNRVGGSAINEKYNNNPKLKLEALLSSGYDETIRTEYSTRHETLDNGIKNKLEKVPDPISSSLAYYMGENGFLGAGFKSPKCNRIWEVLYRYHVIDTNLEDFKKDFAGSAQGMKDLFKLIDNVTFYQCQCDLLFRKTNQIDNWPDESFNSLHYTVESGIRTPRALAAGTRGFGDSGRFTEPYLCTTDTAVQRFMKHKEGMNYEYCLLQTIGPTGLLVPMIQINGNDLFHLEGQVTNCTLHTGSIGSTEGYRTCKNPTLRHFFSQTMKSSASSKFLYTKPGIFGSVRVPMIITRGQEVPGLQALVMDTRYSKDDINNAINNGNLRYAPIVIGNKGADSINFTEARNLNAQEAIMAATTHHYQNTIGTALQCIKQGHQGDVVLHEGQ